MKLRYSEHTGGVYRDGAIVGTVTRQGKLIVYRHLQLGNAPTVTANTLEELLPLVRELLAKAADIPSIRNEETNEVQDSS